MNDEYCVFISSTSRDLGDCRAAITQLLESYCLKVKVQTAYPVTVDAPFQEIDDKIISADLVLCLIGAEYGQPLPDDSPGVPEKMSWTQYEYWKSGQLAKKRWVFFHCPTEAPPPSPQAPHHAALQAQFASTVRCEQVQGNSRDPFFREFRSKAHILDQLQSYLDEGTDPWIEPLRKRRWNAARKSFRENAVRLWNEAYPDVYTGQADWAPKSSAPPFIDNQKLELLDKAQNEIFLPHLKPAAFVVGRSTEAEALADTGKWTRTTLHELARSMLHQEGDRSGWQGRVFMVSGGGIGKTESLKRLGCLLNGQSLPVEQDREMLAFNIGATSLPATGDAVLSYLVDMVARSGAFPDNSSANEIERFLLRDREQGRIALLIDGLDHIQSDTSIPGFLLEIQTDVTSKWKNCPIVISGRPYVIQSSFSETAADWQQRLLASRWQFCRPCGFEPDQQKVYLGLDSTGQPRINRIPREAQNILSVPRVLRYVRSLDETQLSGIRTPADVYSRAIDNLVSLTMQESAEALKIHPDASPRLPLPGSRPRPVQVEYVKTMLAAAAFVMTMDQNSEGKPNFDRVQVTDAFQQSIYSRVTACGTLGYSEIRESQFRNHFTEGLGAFNAMISNGILEADAGDQRSVDTSIQDLIWDNKSVQCYFAAYWLARFGLKAGCSDPDVFSEQMVWYHESDTGIFGDYYELNRFLAEMPESHRDPGNWLASAEAWYRPPAPEQVDSHRRSAEMMYRAWPTLIQLADEPADNWWNTPYEVLAGRGAGAVRRSPGRKPEIQQARSLLGRFRGELQAILNGEQGSRRQQFAQDFINEEHWKQVPAGSYRMGCPADQQGFPKKSEAYWSNQLQRVIEGASPREVSEECNNPEWFRGAQGIRFRKDDVEWLCDVLNELARNRDPSRVEEARKTAMAEIEGYWRRKDESPVEPIQDVAAFEMQDVPMLNRWFWLFAQGHQQSVRDYLKENVGLQEAARQNVAATTELNPEHDDHPVIFVSWFDVWAFCQWARWSVADPADAGRTIQYRCRLPHEAEWEFAARRDANGPIPFEQRYWWGDEFYDDDNSPRKEEKSNELAHAQGQPGRTRAPREAAPNGFGFRDILGNVWEWAANVYFGIEQPDGTRRWAYSRTLPTAADPPKVNSQRAMRGGLWYFLDVLARCSSRFRLDSDDRDYKMGFRAVRERVDAG